MRALKVVVYAEHPSTLPIAYNELVQGVLYGCWRENIPEVHETGISVGEKSFRMFTFGPLKGKCSVRDKLITFEGLVSFEVRSYFEDLLYEVAAQLAGRGEVRLGAHVLPLVDLRTCDRLLFPSQALIHMVSPVTLHETLDDGHTRYFAPGEREFDEYFRQNVAAKAEALGVAGAETVSLMPLQRTLKKRVTRFKGIYVTGYAGDFIISGAPEMLSLLYDVGIGDANAKGFGVFDIDDRPV